MKIWIALILVGASVAIAWSRRATPAPVAIVPASAAFAATRGSQVAPVGLPAFQGGGPLLGVAEAIAPPPYQVRWQFKAGGEDRASIDNNPVIAGDTVYVADSDGVLHALALADGQERWKYKSEGGFATSPLVLGGRVYLGDLDGTMHCVSADKGAKVWTYDSGGSIHSSANATPDGKLILFGNDGAAVFALNAADGKKAWEGKGGDRINACPAIAVGGAYGDAGAAMFTGCDARLMALNLKDGTERFATELGGMAPGSPAVLPDRVIAATGEGAVLAYSPDGRKQLWKYEDVNQQQAMFYASPAVADGVIVIGCRDRNVHAINAATGKGLWKFPTRGEVDATATISDGRAYIGSKDKKFYVLDLKTGAKDGKPLWEFTTKRAITAGAAIGGGVIVLGDTAGNVYCLEAKK